MEKKAQDESSKETLKSQDSERRIRLNRTTKSKEKIWNDQQKIKNTSKLPRIVRMPTTYYKPIVNPNKSSDDSGDSLPGPSTLEAASMKMKREDSMPEKIKISHIPRLKFQKDGFKENNDLCNRSRSSNNNYNQYIPERRNVQRVNLLINPEFCPDDLVPPASVQSTRPIPTLGQIYGRINMIDSDRLNDWFTALGTPMASIPSSNGEITNSSPPNEFFISGSSSAGSPINCHQEDFEQQSTIAMEPLTNLSRATKPTNEIIGGWQISSDGEFALRDNDSAYKTMSPMNIQKSEAVTPKKSLQSQEEATMTMNTNQTYCVGMSIENPKDIPAPKLGVECCTDTSSLLRQQPTVVLLSGTAPATQKVEESTFTSKSDVSFKSSKAKGKKDANNNTGSSSDQQNIITQVPRVPLPSYTDCFSEVLQKTTNFEIIEGIASNKTPSSDTVIVANMHDVTSVIETKDENEMCDGDDSSTLESYGTKQSKSSDNGTTTTTTFLRSDATVTEWSCKYPSDNSSGYPSPDSCTFRHELNRRYYDDSRNNELRERCKKCQRFKRFPSSRYKFHNIHNLVRSVVWEDVNMQTTMVILNEAGTSATKEQKSAAVSTIFNMGAFQAVPNQIETGYKTSSWPKHVDSGPSMFPFFLNPKKLSNVMITDKNLSGFQFPNCQQNQCTSFNNNFTLKPDATMGVGNSVKSCQYEDKTPSRVERTTSLLGEVEVLLLDQPTDTEDLPNYMTDKKTSMPAPAPVHSSTPATATAHAPSPASAPAFSLVPEPPFTPLFAPPPAPSSAPPSAPSFAPPSLPSFAPPSVPSSAPPATSSFAPLSLPSFIPPSVPPPTPLSAPSFVPPSFTSPSVPSSAPSSAPSFAPPSLPSFAPPTAHSFAPQLAPSSASPPAPSFAPPSLLSFAPPSTLSCIPPPAPPSTSLSTLQPAYPTALPFAPPTGPPTAPSPMMFSSNQIQVNKDVCNADALKPNVIMCHNAEADLGFPGIFTITSSTTVPSGSDITYYRPAGSDITHLISESRTQQALYPILRKYYSNAGSTMNREKDHLVAGIGTQISQVDSLDTTSMGVITCNPVLAETTTSYSNAAINDPTIERVEIATQAETFLPKSAEDREIQISLNKLNNMVSEGVEPSLTGLKDEVFISECVLLANDVEREHSAIQTCSAIQKLAFTGTKIMSISSKELFKNKLLPKTEDKALGSNVTVVFASTAVGSNATIAIKAGSNETMNLKGLSSATTDSKAISNATTSHTRSTSSGETVSSKCACSGRRTPKPIKVSCGTDPSMAVYNFTRSTSAKGVESYYETEILLNKLIKKALIGNNVGTLETPDKVESSYKDRQKIVYVTTSTSTHVGIDTKSIGPTASDVIKLRHMNKTDAEMQYIIQQELAGPSSGRDEMLSVCTLNRIFSDNFAQTEGIDKFEIPTPHKSASMMTSYCGLAAAIQFPVMSETSVKKVSRNSVTPQCTYNMTGIDMETNTNYKRGPVTENLAQTSMVHTRQKSLEVKIFRNRLNKPLQSNTDVHNSVNSQLISLSRLIGKKRTDSSIHSQMPSTWINEIPMETSVHQTTFPNSHNSSSKNVIDTIVLTNEDNQMRKSCTFTLKTDNHLCNDNDNPVPYELPNIILSKDSLADVLPIIKSKDVYNKKSETQIALNPTKVDVFTSDNYVSKDVKESMLQACPEICDTGTESLNPTYSKKSACMLTTQCLLPVPPQCSGGQLYLPKRPDCVFVYGEPRCVVHKACADAGIQLDPPADKEVKRACVTHSIGQLTSYCSLRDGTQRNPSALIREVLSPKVYKALYETTKLVVSKEMKQSSSKNTTVVAARVDAEVDAAKFEVPKLKSAGMLTSEVMMMGSKSRCHCRDRGPRAHCKRTLHQIKKSEELHNNSSHASHEEITEECCEDCMRRQLVTSCRYYSNLLTKQLGRVKNNLAKHLAPSLEQIEPPPQQNNEVCTMKPSGRKTFGSQTIKHGSQYNDVRPVSCCLLSPATSLTNICKYDKAHLKSVYYMLSAIEGRLRRLKLNSPSTYNCQ